MSFNCDQTHANREVLLRIHIQITGVKYDCTSTEKTMQIQFPLNGCGNTSDALTCVIFKYRQTRNNFFFPINLEDSRLYPIKYHISSFGGTPSLFGGMNYSTFGHAQPREHISGLP